MTADSRENIEAYVARAHPLSGVALAERLDARADYVQADMDERHRVAAMRAVTLDGRERHEADNTDTAALSFLGKSSGIPEEAVLRSWESSLIASTLVALERAFSLQSSEQPHAIEDLVDILADLTAPALRGELGSMLALAKLDVPVGKMRETYERFLASQVNPGAAARQAFLAVIPETAAEAVEGAPARRFAPTQPVVSRIGVPSPNIGNVRGA